MDAVLEATARDERGILFDSLGNEAPLSVRPRAAEQQIVRDSGPHGECLQAAPQLVPLPGLVRGPERRGEHVVGGGHDALESPALARRVEVVEDPALTALTPAARPARVEIRLRDGRMLVRQVDQPWGEFDRPYPEALLRDKFAALASPDLGARGAGSAWDLCRSAGGAKSVRDLTDGLRALAVPRHPA